MISFKSASDRLNAVKQQLTDARGPGWVSRWVLWQTPSAENHFSGAVQDELGVMLSNNPEHKQSLTDEDILVIKRNLETKGIIENSRDCQSLYQHYRQGFNESDIDCQAVILFHRVQRMVKLTCNALRQQITNTEQRMLEKEIKDVLDDWSQEPEKKQKYLTGRRVDLAEELTSTRKVDSTMSVNTANTPDGRGVLIFNGEVILVFGQGVVMTIGKNNNENLDGKFHGSVYLTSHRVIFMPEDGRTFRSFEMPFSSMQDVHLEQPIFGANYLKGIALAMPGSNISGEIPWRLTFNKGGCIDFGRCLLEAVDRAERFRPRNAPPAYAPPRGDFYAAPPDYYAPPSNGTCLYNSGLPFGNFQKKPNNCQLFTLCSTRIKEWLLYICLTGAHTAFSFLRGTVLLNRRHMKQ
ncbi:unnamed protein product [Nippostrongylus brasiliensis]|uniref:Putative ww domain-binding protein 2 (inferred by orthology to a S. mansoni protein) n=1 Tax=Nippostrongylus brasiliensis TaxID=27835 RepID=A0A0N4XHQ6_NIPBR|nr:unnamed protein product [Nippostrongylus brasiliensis]